MRKKRKRNATGISKPPNRLWTLIEHRTHGEATLSYYYSDPHSKVPIRDVTNKRDPKLDPNLETLTYGLFSHCNKQERRSIVENGIRHQFFCTARGGGIRVLTGYYQTGWYYEANRGDYMIRAKRARFVSPGFPLRELREYLDPFPIARFFRSWRYVPEKVAALLLSLIDESDDESTLYLSELRRLERWSLDKYGRVYLERLKGCSRRDIPREMRLRSRPLRNKVTSSDVRS